MADLSQALSEIKSMPDHVLSGELKNPTGKFPGWLALGEIHERKRLRATTGGGDPNKRKSMAEEYAGSVQPMLAGAGMQPPPQPPPPQAMPPQGIAGLPQQPSGYASGGIVSLAKGGRVSRADRYNADIDPRVADIINRAGENSPFQVRLISGYRPGDPRYHGEHKAVDVELVNPETGEVLENYQSGKHFTEYQTLANRARQIQMEAYPELNDKFRWGGYFSGPKGKYGAMDLMHFDIGGQKTAGGSWETGLTPEQAALYNINQTGGGVTGGSGVNYRQAFLDTIASGESSGRDPYRQMYGGRHFGGDWQHPGMGQTILSGPNQGDQSTAAGRYQFLKGTWEEQAKKYGYKDFSPANQDLAAWNYANDVYKAKTGGDLASALQSGDAGQIANVGKALSGTWTSLPGGIEQSTGTNQFVATYQKALGNPSTAVAQAAGDAGAKMAAAEQGAEQGLGGDNPMAQYMMATQLMGKGTPTQSAPPAAAAVRPGVPVDARQFVQNPGFMLAMERRRMRG